LARYLADSSIWSWANKGKRPDLRAKLAERFERGEVVTSAPIALEVMHRARNGKEYESLYEQLFEPLEQVALTDAVAKRALEVQREMAGGTHGNHMRPAIDYLIAAIAEKADEDVVLWGLDKDLRIIAEHTGQPYEAET
jgi:predicted nucleic acid-binding protein